MNLVFHPSLFLALGGAGVALIVGLIVGYYRPGKGEAVAVGGEGMMITLFAGVLSHLFVAGLILLGGQRAGANLLIGWALFIVPGLVDSFAAIGHAQPLTNSDSLLWIGTAVGTLTGAFNALYLIYPW